jgi:hypothetical protein
MYRNPVSFCFGVLICIPAFAGGQTPPASTAPATTIHTSADLVVVDVVASDPQKNPVHHLTSAEFTVLEDGKPQTLKVFEEHATARTASCMSRAVEIATQKSCLRPAGRETRRAEFAALPPGAGRVTIGSSIGFVTRIRDRIRASSLVKIFQ